MIPTWVLTTLVIIVGCILASLLGSTLPDYGDYGPRLVILTIICVLCAAVNNFPLLLALSTWSPTSLPIPIFHTFPTFVLIEFWIALILFFRLCLMGSLSYVRSYSIYLLIVFSWVGIRFLMNPIHKFGASVDGGMGVSGISPYFNYAMAAATMGFLGAVLNTRDRVVAFLRWSFRCVLGIGTFLFVCAFIPGTAPMLAAMGSFQAGNMGDGIQRLVQLPGYGLFLTEVALCPALFRLTKLQATGVFLIGFAMEIIGGNRSAMAAMFIAIPVILFLRRKGHAMFLTGFLMCGAILMMRFAVSESNGTNIPPLLRSFGIFDSRVDEATGGTASAAWRYSVWTSAWGKILESPMTGKGFGNLPQNLDPSMPGVAESTDFEVVLAGGEAHNGFITSAYAFGLPFTAALTLAIVFQFFRHSRLALGTDKHDEELRDAHVFLTSQYATYPILIYTAFDMSVMLLWVYTALGIILYNLGRTSTVKTSPILDPSLQGYGNQPYSAAPYA